MGSDNVSAGAVTGQIRFQSTLPAWGATTCRPGKADDLFLFQSTLPAWGATTGEKVVLRAFFVSIHAPRMGSDSRALSVTADGFLFQSTLPAWGATAEIFKHFRF